MIAITTHVNADFDCLASMVAAAKLHPGGEIVFSGSQEKNVRDFLSTAGFNIPVTKLKNFDLDKVTTLVVVDATPKGRLGPFNDLIGKEGVSVIVYDHHPQAANKLMADEVYVAPRGSCTTLMTEIIRQRGIAVSREEATLFMLGIYEDTGSLTFTSTRMEDFEAAAWLLGKGADLNIVADCLRRHLSQDQKEMLNELLNRLEFHQINGVEVATAFASSRRYIGDLSAVVHALQEMESAYVLFVVVEMEGRINLIARSRVPAVDAGSIASTFGGGGHQTAASAVIRDMLMEDLRGKLLKTLENSIPPVPTAGDMMVSPVFSIPPETAIGEAEALLTRYNFNALPVCQGRSVLGIITRQTVEKALYHGLDRETVANYMTADVARVTVDAPYETIKEIIIRRKQKVIPVVNAAGEMVGIIGRMDVMHAMYADMIKSQVPPPRSERRVARPVSRDLSAVMRERLPAEVQRLLHDVAGCASECGYIAYAVGGFVRDLVMRRKNFDVDVVIEGDGIEFAHRFAEKHGGKVRPHKKFATAIVALGSHRKMDVATARTEYYTEPAALPIVEMSSIKNDLYRRDFTINALAIKLNGKNENHLIDFFGGQQDLKDEVIRVLHNLSFVEDPTRIFRAVRFAQRFHMNITGQTERLMKLAIENRLIERISGARLFGELRMIFNEEQPTRAMRRMEEYGLWGFVHPAIRFNEEMLALCRRAEEALAWHRLTSEDKNARAWMVYLLCLAGPMTSAQAREMMERLGFMREPAARFALVKERISEAAGRVQKKPPHTPVEIYESYQGFDDEGLVALMASVSELHLKKTIVEFATRLRYVRPRSSGSDLMNAGIPGGPLLGKILEAVRRENINGLLTSKEEEVHFAQAYYRKLAGQL